MIKKKKKTQITNIMNKRGDITEKFTDLERITREYYKEFYVNKLDHLDEKNKFLKKHNLSKMT